MFGTRHHIFCLYNQTFTIIKHVFRGFKQAKPPFPSSPTVLVTSQHMVVFRPLYVLQDTQSQTICLFVTSVITHVVVCCLEWTGRPCGVESWCPLAVCVPAATVRIHLVVKVPVTEASSVPSCGGRRMNQHPSDRSAAVDIFSAVTPHVCSDSGSTLHLSHLSLKRCRLL